jgi:hypothetical protein
MDELRHWAAQNYDNSEKFWLAFADKVCEAVRDGRASMMEVSALYGLYEDKNDKDARIRDMESWM